MKLNVDQPLTDLKGEPLKSVKIGWMRAVSYTVNQAKSGKDIGQICRDLEKEEGEVMTRYQGR